MCAWTSAKGRVVLVQRLDKEDRYMLHELRELAEAAGYEVVGEVVQRRDPDPRYQIGRGKVGELKKIIDQRNVKKVIFFNFLKPNQVYNLRKELGVEVIDRFELILEIFAERAGSKEAKLQIELAKLKRELSFVREYINLQKRGELHGYLGGGERAADAYYEYVVSRIAKIEDELRALRRSKSFRWRRRGETGIYTIALTGYTGAGKTTLFSRLTGANGYVDGKPFATLSTKTRLTYLEGLPVLVTDTIGFIDCLPEQLLDAFYTTLGEITYSDLVLFLVDASEELDEVRRKIMAGLAVLSSLGVPKSRIVAVANKADIAGERLGDAVRLLRALEFPEVVAISAKTGLNVDLLRRVIKENLPDRVESWLRVPGAVMGPLLDEASRSCRVAEFSFDGSYFVVKLEGRRSFIESLARKYAQRELNVQTCVRSTF